GETLANKAPPERSDAILRAVLDARERSVIPAKAGIQKPLSEADAFVETPHLHLVTESPRRRKIGIGIAAASIVAGVALMLWPTENELPPGVMVARGATIETEQGWIELKKGWLIATARAGSIRAGEARIDAVSGRVVIKQGEIPNNDEVEAMAAWLRDQGVEANMLKDRTKWLKRGALALVIVSGTALCDGVLVSAEDTKDAKEAPAQEQGVGTAEAPMIVHSIADIEALPAGVQYVKCEGITDAHLDFLTELRPGIRSLDLRGCNVTSIGVSYVTRLKELVNLDIVDCRAIGTLEDIRRLTKLSVLSLSQGTLGTISYPTLSGYLEKLKIEEFRFTFDVEVNHDDLLGFVSDFPYTTDLTFRSVSKPVNDSGSNVFPQCIVSDNMLKVIATLPKIRALHIDRGMGAPSLSDAGFAYLKITSIHTLILDGAFVGGPELAMILRMGSLEVLQLPLWLESGNSRNFPVLNLPRLKELRVKCYCQNRGVQDLSILQGCENLERLVIENWDYRGSNTSYAIESFQRTTHQGAGKFEKLQHLELININVIPSNLKALIDAPHLTSLTLRTSWASAGSFDEVISKFPTLSTLNIWSCQFLPELNPKTWSSSPSWFDIEDLKPLQKAKNLKRLWLSASLKTEVYESTDALKEMFPGVEVDLTYRYK
ncbi:MAG: hypothetical protein L6Q71_09685, partial [Planctomycetes bacterium]|nr:hypothetical protein [Planctomycetota bacterium]